MSLGLHSPSHAARFYNYTTSREIPETLQQAAEKTRDFNCRKHNYGVFLKAAGST